MTEVRGAGHSTSVSTFEALYRAHFGLVWRLLRRLGVRSASLDDAVQEVFLVVHRRRGELQVEGDGKALLVGIAAKVARDQRRSESRADRRDQALISSGPLREDPPDPHRAAERSQGIELALRLLDSLSAERREVFVMTELEELTAPVIAEALEVPLNTVYSRLRLARADFEAAVRQHQEGAVHV